MRQTLGFFENNTEILADWIRTMVESFDGNLASE